MKRMGRLGICIGVLFVLLTGILGMAEPSAELSIIRVAVECEVPVCGQEADAGPYCILKPVAAVEQGEPSAWVSAWNENSYTPLEGAFLGGQTYTALVTLNARQGYRFDSGTCVTVYNNETAEYEAIVPLVCESSRLILAIPVKADHDWDWETSTETMATCVSEGHEHKVCAVDPSHILDITYPIEPNGHQWGEWETVREAMRSEEGEKRRACELCGEEERETVGKLKLPYTDVFEPETSWDMAATIAWRADSGALGVASAAERPATAFVWLDGDLNVYDRDGALISDDLGGYIDATAGGMIPAFYIRDARTAAALKAFLPDSGLLDCFVVSTPRNKALVKDVAYLVHVRGMLDYTAVKSPDRKALLDMVASTNEAHGKVILISAEAATRENVRQLQKLASTVWVQTPTDMNAILTAYTNGVNGVVVDDYRAAIRAEAFFQDDAPSLLRVPFIIGHRGDPSTYVENTLDSARGAYEEGVDSVENDIQLSADGQIYILHDDIPGRLLCLEELDEEGEAYYAEHYTLEQLRAHPFRWESIVAENEVTPSSSRYGTLYGQDEEKVYTVPTLREYIEAFRETGLVHDTEIKSYNPAIIPVYKALVDEYDAWDQFFTITFNAGILEAVYRDWPEISIGALNLAEWVSPEEFMEGESDAQAKLRTLFDAVDRWNATYNPSYMGDIADTVKAARHRGLTTWPWTYRIDFDAEGFARDYLRGYAGLTVDYPWIASDYIVEIDAEDVTADSADQIPGPTGRTQSGQSQTLESAEPVLVEKLSDTQMLAIWRCRAKLDINGTDYGEYYLYSNPFIITKLQ